MAIAEELAEQGWHVVAVARTVGGLEELDDRIKARRPGSELATLAPMDITNDDADFTKLSGTPVVAGRDDVDRNFALQVSVGFNF